MNREDINLAHFYKTKCTLKIKVSKKKLLIGKYISWSPSLSFITEIKWERFDQFWGLKNDFESQNFAIFNKVVHKSDEDMI